LAFCIGCTTTAPYVWADRLPPQAAEPSDDRIRTGDTVSVIVKNQEALSGEHVVGADGGIAVPVVGRITLAQKTPDQAAAELKSRLGKIVVDPRVTVAIVARSIEVTVLGEVDRPGKYNVKSEDGVLSALALAGGLTEFAQDDAIFVLRRSLPNRVRFRYEDLIAGKRSSVDFTLRDRDVVVVE
jgi:polysaccharide export outer membrane protein